MSEQSSHEPDRTAVHDPQAAGNPLEGVPDGLATRVSIPYRMRSSLRWARDRGASVSNRDLTLTLVTTGYSTGTGKQGRGPSAFLGL
jgi:hypothetical protein